MTEPSHCLPVREGCPLGGSHQGKTMKQTWPSTLDAHLALAAGLLTILRLVSNLTALSHCPFITVKFSASLFFYTVKTSFYRNCSKTATLSSQHLGCTCMTCMHTCPSSKMYLQWFPAHSGSSSSISDNTSTDSQLANFQVLSQIEDMPYPWLFVLLFPHPYSGRTSVSMLMMPKSHSHLSYSFPCRRTVSLGIRPSWLI